MNSSESFQSWMAETLAMPLMLVKPQLEPEDVLSAIKDMQGTIVGSVKGNRSPDSIVTADDRKLLIVGTLKKALSILEDNAQVSR
jgi:hypothetical protein